MRKRVISNIVAVCVIVLPVAFIASCSKEEAPAPAAGPAAVQKMTPEEKAAAEADSKDDQAKIDAAKAEAGAKK